jgi:polysaccharide export outer membrane protein
MGREGGKDDGGNDGTNQETLSFAEFLNREDPRSGADGAALVLGDSVDGRLVFPLTRNPTVIGRSNNADLVLADPAMSDFHARIIKHIFGYTVEDMGSAEGTFLRDRRVSHARLVSGDTLRLGTTTLTFLGEQASSPKAKTMALALLPPRGTVRGLATRHVVPRTRYSHPGNLEDGQAQPAWTPARTRRPGESDEDEKSIDDVLIKIIHAARFIRRHVWLIFILAVTGVGLGAASFKYYPPVRAAQCLVTLYSAPKTNPIAPEEHQAQSDSMHFFVGAERAFTSPETIMATLKRLGVPHPNEAQAEGIAKRMRFERLDGNTYMGTLTPRLLDRRDESHVLFLDTHVKNYIETEIEKKLKVFIAEVDFLRSQTEAADKRLQEISQETVKFREAHSDQILAQSALASSPPDLETRRIGLTGQISRLAGELEGIRSQLARGSALSQAKAQSGQSDREALASVNRKLTELQAQGFADGHPDVQRLLSERGSLQKAVDDHLRAEVTQFEKRSNVAYDSLQSQADQLEAQLRAARSELGFIEANRRSLRTVSSEAPKVNARLDELLRMKEDAVRQHGLLFDRLKKAEVQLQLERVSTSSRYEIVAPARLDYPPGRKAFATRLAFGLGIGLLLAALVLGISELRRMIVRVAQATATSAILLAFLGSLASGCAHDGRFTWAEDLPANNLGSESVIHPRDTLLVEVSRQPTLSGEFIVRDDGHYSQPMVGSIRVADQTPSQAAAAIADALKGVVVAPVVSVWISKTTSIRVSVVGEVKTPGTYELTRDRGLLPALALAGWLTEFAHSDRVFVIRVRTNERIRFRVRDITTAEAHAAQFQLADGDVVVVE